MERNPLSDQLPHSASSLLNGFAPDSRRSDDAVESTRRRDGDFHGRRGNGFPTMRPSVVTCESIVNALRYVHFRPLECFAYVQSQNSPHRTLLVVIQVLLGHNLCPYMDLTSGRRGRSLRNEPT